MTWSFLIATGVEYKRYFERERFGQLKENYFTLPKACLIPPRGTSLLYGITHQDTVDPEETCQGPHITQYQISFETGSTVNTENVSTSVCTAGRCSYTFEPPSNPPSSYDNVSVAAENVVGVGDARTCTSQTISESLVLCMGIYINLLVEKFYIAVDLVGKYALDTSTVTFCSFSINSYSITSMQI